MSTASEPSPDVSGFDVGTAHAARVYDCLLDGKDNFAPDREVAGKTVAAFPEAKRLAQQQRDFLRRITAHAAEHGIGQFLELGSGLPTVKNVHEVAQSIASNARIVYIDHDPLVRSHGEALLATNDLTRVVIADLRQPDAVLGDPRVTALLDVDQPIAVSLVGVTHFLRGTRGPHEIVAAYRDRLAPGSSIGISAATSTESDPEMVAGIRAAYENSSSPIVFRSAEEITRFFDGLTIIDPGIVDVCTWRDSGSVPPDGVRVIGAVGLIT